MTEPIEYLEDRDAAALLRVSVRTLQRWRNTGDGPPFIRAGQRRALYSRAAIDQWTAARTFAHHAAEAARKCP